MPTAQEIIDHLKLIPLEVEGGFFRRYYEASEILTSDQLPERYGVDKPYGVAIYYLLTNDSDSFSAMHKLPTDEIFHFYIGDPVEMINLYPDGSSQHITLGHDILNGQTVAHVVPRGVWQGCRLIEGGQWALMGTTMAPGFTDDDYTGGIREELIAQYPNEAALITALTRPNAALDME